MSMSCRDGGSLNQRDSEHSPDSGLRLRWKPAGRRTEPKPLLVPGHKNGRRRHKHSQSHSQRHLGPLRSGAPPPGHLAPSQRPCAAAAHQPPGQSTISLHRPTTAVGAGHDDRARATPSKATQTRAEQDRPSGWGRWAAWLRRRSKLAIASAQLIRQAPMTSAGELIWRIRSDWTSQTSNFIKTRVSQNRITSSTRSSIAMLLKRFLDYRQDPATLSSRSVHAMQ